MKLPFYFSRQGASRATRIERSTRRDLETKFPVDHATLILPSLQVAPPFGGAPRLGRCSHTSTLLHIYIGFVFLSPRLASNRSLLLFSTHRFANAIVPPPRSLSASLRRAFTYYLPPQCSFHSRNLLSSLLSLLRAPLCPFPPFVFPITERSLPGIYRGVRENPLLLSSPAV